MNFLINCLILLIFLNYVFSQCTNCTTHMKTFNNLLSRKRRYLVFPTNSFMIVTASGFVSIQMKAPKGYNLVGEMDLFFPLPTKVLRSQRKRTTTPKPITTTEHPHEYLPEHSHEHLPEYPHNLLAESHSFDEINWKEKSPFWSENHIDRSSSDIKNNYVPWEYGERNPYEFTNFKKDDFKYKMDDNVDDKWNELHHRHRERRDIYDKIQSMLSLHDIDFKHCILRSICESQHFLLPPGKSMFHDMFRAVFTIPANGGTQDDYSEAMGTSKKDCYAKYAKECPISILDYALNSNHLFSSSLNN